MGRMVDAGPAAAPPPRRATFGRATVLTYGTQLIVAVLSLVNVLVVSWALGADGRGDVAFLTTIAYLTGSLSTLGIEQANANLAAREEHARPALATNSLALAALVGSFAALLVAMLFAAVPAAGGDVGWTLQVLTLATVPLIVFQVALDYLVRAEYGVMHANVAWLLQPVANVAINGALAVAGELTVGRALVAWVVGQGLTVVVLVHYLVTRGAGFGRPDRRLASRSVGFGLRAHAGRVLTLGNYRLDQWILGAVSGSRQLGLYSVAVSWAEALFYLPTAITLVQRPDLVRASKEDAASGAERAFRLAILVTAPLAIALVIAAPILCVVVFPDEFRDSIPQLRVLALGGFGIVALKLLGNALTAQGRPLLASAGTAVAFATTVALDLLLIPSHGGMGAAIASTVAYTVGGIAVVVLFVRALGGRTDRLVPRGSDVAALRRALTQRA
jgi:O-antigen/teichoic acid export membrane protein